MSIGFSFKAETDNLENLVTAIDELALSYGCKAQSGENEIWIELCTTGVITFKYKEAGKLKKKIKVDGECFSTPAGPGFHKAAIELVEALGESCLKNLSIEDETNYIVHRNFWKMRQESFISWIESLIRFSKYKADEYAGNQALCWDINSYTPKTVEGTVVTPMGRYYIQEMIDNGPEWFAERFLFWNYPERDATFYRNHALNLLWEDCNFMLSERSADDDECNKKIIANLERAYELDNDLLLPVAEYYEICKNADHKPVIPEDSPQISYSFPIGFRKDYVINHILKLNLPMPGNLIYEWEEGTMMWYDPADDGQCWRVTCFSINKPDDEELEFPDTNTEGEGHEEIRIRNCKARWYYYPLEEEGEHFWQIMCEAIVEKNLFLITVTYEYEEERESIYELLRKIDARA